jgi:hypothetical protein
VTSTGKHLEANYSPHCDNKFILEAKTPELAVGVEADDPRMNGKFLKDHRIKQTSITPF